jgi:hypothetical protein
MLDEATERLAERWQPGLEKMLLRSRSEMPVRARQFVDLMALMTNERPESIKALEIDSDLDLALLAEEMKLLLSRGNANEALNLFRATSSGRTPRFDSVLYPVHVRAIAQSGDLDRAMAMALKGLDRLEEARKVISPRYEELLLLCCQVTQAQHAAGSKSTRSVFSSHTARRSELVQADELWQRFYRVNVTSDSDRPVLVLRIAIALLELFDTERVVGSDDYFNDGSKVGFCAKRALSTLSRLRPAFFDVDGGLLVRSMAWLSDSVGPEPEVRELLGVPQAMAVLIRDYGAELENELTKERTLLAQDLVEWLRSISQVRNSPFSEPGRLTDEQTRKLGAVLKRLIRARDNEQGAHFS